MKKILMATMVLLLLAACSDQTVEKKTEVAKTNQEKEVKQEGKVEKKPDNQPPENKEEIHKYITEEEFNKKFKLDPDETQYKDGKFQLKDGSITKADDFSYTESDVFDYATAIFKNGTLVHLQIETEKSPEEIEKGLGIKFNDGNTVEKNRIGYEINFDETFSDSNIKVFPSEW